MRIYSPMGILLYIPQVNRSVLCMSNVTVAESVLEHEVLEGKVIYSMVCVSTSIAGRVIVVQYASEHSEASACETAIFRTIDGECEYLGSGTELVEYPFVNE